MLNFVSSIESNIEKNFYKFINHRPLPKFDEKNIKFHYNILSSNSKRDISIKVRQLFEREIHFREKTLRIASKGWYFIVPLIAGIALLVFSTAMRGNINPFGFSTTGRESDFLTCCQFCSYVMIGGGIVGKMLQNPMVLGSIDFIKELKNARVELFGILDLDLDIPRAVNAAQLPSNPNAAGACSVPLSLRQPHRNRRS